MIVADQAVDDGDLRHAPVQQVGDDGVPLFNLRQHVRGVGGRYTENISRLLLPRQAGGLFAAAVHGRRR